MWYLKGCRSCLTTTANFIRIDSQTRKLFGAITGLGCEEDDGFPQFFCVECYTLIKKLVWFRRRSRRAHFVLKEIDAVKKQVRQLDIENIDRNKTNLTSPYSYWNPKTAVAYSLTTADAIDLPYKDQATVTPDIEAAINASLGANTASKFNITCDTEKKTIQVYYMEPVSSEKTPYVELVKQDISTIGSSSIIINIKPANWRDIEKEEEDRKNKERQEEIQAALKEINDEVYDDDIANYEDVHAEDIDLEDVFKGLKEDDSEPEEWVEESEKTIKEEKEDRIERKRKIVCKRRYKKEKIPTNRYNFFLKDPLLEEIFSEVKIKYLSIEEQLRQFQNILSSEPFKSALFKCAICVVCFKTVEQLKTHCDFHKNKLMYEHYCNVCSDRFKTEVELKQHGGLMHWYRYSCPRCKGNHYTLEHTVKCFSYNCLPYKPPVFDIEYQFAIEPHAPEDMYSTLAEWSGNHKGSLWCKKCKIYYTTVKSHERHIRRHEPGKKLKYLCDICSMGYESLAKLRKHMELWHIYRYTCKNCKETFRNHSQARDHVRGGRGPVCYVCAVCGEGFRGGRAKIAAHAAAHRAECSACGFAATTRARVRMHEIRAHGYIRLNTEAELFDPGYRCDQCRVYFADEKVLFTHLAREKHDAANNYEYGCVPCLELFDSKSEFEDHQSICERVFPRQCKFCSITVTSAWQYERHKTIAHEEVPQIKKDCGELCNICGKVVSKIYHHLRVHRVGSAPERLQLQCKFCAAACSSAAQFVSHVVYNHTAKPYSCTLCDARFLHRTTCRDHILKTHAPVRPYRCEACARSFAHLDLLHEHCARAHAVSLKQMDKSVYLSKRMFGKVYSYPHMRIDGSLIDLNVLEKTPVYVCDYMDENEKRVEYTEVFFFDPEVDPTTPTRSMPPKKKKRSNEKDQERNRKRKKLKRLMAKEKKEAGDEKAISDFVKTAFDASANDGDKGAIGTDVCAEDGENVDLVPKDENIEEETEDVLGQLIEKDGEYYVLVDGELYTVDENCLEALKAQQL